MVYLSALTGTLRVTELSKTFPCRGTRSRCCWVFPINKSSLVQPLFDRSSVNYGGYLVIFCVVNPADYSIAWCFPHKQSGVMYHISRCRLVMRHKNEWNASLSLICSICRIALPWCFCFFFCRYGEEQTSLCAHKITWCLEAYLDKHTHNGNTTFVPFNAIHSHYRVLEWPNPFIIVCIGANGIFDVASLCISCKIRCVQFILYYNMENSTIQEVLLVWWWCSFKLKLLAVKL